MQGQIVLLRLENLADRTVAETLRGKDVLITADQAVTLPKGEFYWHQVIGLEVIDATTQAAAWPTSPISWKRAPTTSTSSGRRAVEILIPAIKDVVKDIDPALGRMLVEPLPGMLPGAESPAAVPHARPSSSNGWTSAKPIAS